jgi:phosphoribosyl-ATP pyrophosphohydrolase/phosphoribosyl-AMP cyclohydrolase
LSELSEFAAGFLFTCVEREGTMTGIDINLVRRLRAATDNQLTVAGGIATMDELRELSGLGLDVQLGMALYTGRIDLAQAFIETLNWRSELLPTITQNPAGQVLMLGYSNRASLGKTFATGAMHYYSRSRGRLWMKGETSGHTQTLIRLRADCDRDTILATAIQQGPACHLGTDSCFGDLDVNLAVLGSLVEASGHRRSTPGAAASGDELVHEAADLLEALAARLAEHGVSVEAVLQELKSRYWRRR